MKTKERVRRYLQMWLTFLLLVLATAAESATVSGTVTNHTNIAGRVFIVGKGSFGNAGWGRSVPIAANGTADFTIRGVQDGNYVLDAFLDTQNSGIQHANDPAGMSAQFNVTGGADNVSIDLYSPTPVALQPPAGAQVVSGDGGVLVMWEPATNQNGKEIATSYKVYWSTSPNPGPLNTTGGGSSVDSPALGDVNAYFRSFTNGTQLYFSVTAKLGGVESAPVNAYGKDANGNYVLQVTIGPATGGVPVSGTVTTTGTTLGAGKPLYLALAANDGPPQYIGRIVAPSTSQPFSIPGVTSGNYRLYAILDMDNNGFFNVGDISNVNGDGVPVFVAATPVTNANVILAAGNATVSVKTEHSRQNASDWYSLNLLASANSKRPVNAAVSGPNLSVGTIDMPVSTWGPLESWPNLTARPALSDSYSFAIEYHDGTNTGASPLVASVMGIVDSFATLVTPAGLVPYPFLGNFSWSAPASPPTPYAYGFWLDVPGFNDDSFYSMPSSTTAVLYPYGFIDGSSYNWNISVVDGLGNRARQWVNFTPTTAPVITAFSPPSGVPGTLVTITGFNFDTPSNNQVLFNGTQAEIVSASYDLLEVRVPNGATTGPIVVNDLTSGKFGSSTEPFTVIADLTAPVVTANPAGGLFSGSIGVYLTANEPATIYYTTNGADPTTSSPSFIDNVGNVPKGPIVISTSTILKYFARDLSGNSSAIQTQTYTASMVKVGTKEFPTIQTGYNDAATGNNAVLKVRAGTLTETDTFARNIAVTLDGGYDSTFGSVTGTTKVKGKLLVRAGTVRVRKVSVF